MYWIHISHNRHKIQWRMPSSGMLGCVALVRIDVSEEGRASIIRVTRMANQQPTHAAKKFYVLTRATRRNIPEDDIFQSPLWKPQILELSNIGCYERKNYISGSEQESGPCVTLEQNKSLYITYIYIYIYIILLIMYLSEILQEFCMCYKASAAWWLI
jgi:hypothetical protein